MNSGLLGVVVVGAIDVDVAAVAVAGVVDANADKVLLNADTELVELSNTSAKK